MTDRLVLKGLGAADGTYEFDFADLVNVAGGGPEALTLREQQRIKILSGYTGLEIRDRAAILDPAVMVALVDALVVRAGKAVSSTRLWDAKMLTSGEDEVVDLDQYRVAFNFHLGGLNGDTVDLPNETPDEQGEEVEADPEA